ncbi:D-2-hydroxyacid dehydrogenase [Anaeromicropila populeti]|uniref:Glycerate dehydrogenase n=1 Tax=Anaeromicropila populeti TaxID=37658 RepID=A0A1I6IAM9_9FIRM|nr:D-2-hydroxyacid dehydrogenase [Anaeromicropila populeti]SFR63684.1 glycerate dehydrogenase [Anaeromicropila populeti]
MKIVFLETQTLGETIDFEPFKRFGEVELYELTRQNEIRERVLGAEVVIVNKLPVNEKCLGEAQNLKLVCITATGTNNVDFAFTQSRNITVTNVKGYSTAAVVQHTFALLFYLMEQLPYYDNYVKQEEYTLSPMFTHLGKEFHELCGMTWGIVGLGSIGEGVARIARGFGCNVIYYSTSGNNHNFEYTEVDFEKLLQESDIISVHAPLTEQTDKLFTYEVFQKMKKNCFFLNLGRGPIVEEEGLKKALEEGEIAGAGLDVLTEEPMSEGNPLIKIKDSGKLIITPHIAWASIEARGRLMKEVFLNIDAFCKGIERNVVK